MNTLLSSSMRLFPQLDNNFEIDSIIPWKFKYIRLLKDQVVTIGRNSITKENFESDTKSFVKYIDIFIIFRYN